MRIAKKEVSSKEAAKEVEAVLFSSGRWMDIQELSRVCRIKEQIVKDALNILKKKYGNEDTALKLSFDNGRWKLNVKKEYSESVRKVVSRTELNKTVIETLAVIAWKAPVLQSNIIKMRTNKAYDDIRLLKEEGFITKEKRGRTYLIRLTKKFFNYFEIDENEGLNIILKKIEEKENPKESVEIFDESSGGEREEHTEEKEEANKEEGTIKENHDKNNEEREEVNKEEGTIKENHDKNNEEKEEANNEDHYKNREGETDKEGEHDKNTEEEAKSEKEYDKNREEGAEGGNERDEKTIMKEDKTKSEKEQDEKTIVEEDETKEQGFGEEQNKE